MEHLGMTSWKPPLSSRESHGSKVCIPPTSSLCPAGRSFRSWPISGIRIKAKRPQWGDHLTQADGLLFQLVYYSIWYWYSISLYSNSYIYMQIYIYICIYKYELLINILIHLVWYFLNHPHGTSRSCHPGASHALRGAADHHSADAAAMACEGVQGVIDWDKSRDLRRSHGRSGEAVVRQRWSPAKPRPISLIFREGSENQWTSHNVVKQC